MQPKIVIGLGFGDEGKGMTVAHEVRGAIDEGLRPTVVRFNGGPQAGHNVRVVRNGEVLHHTHSQFGSGALLGAQTMIARGMLLDPLAFLSEGEHLSKLLGEDALMSVSIDDWCPIVLPMHVMANRELERDRRDSRHGSTGNGVGVARRCLEAAANGKADPSMVVRLRSLYDPTDLVAKLEYWQGWVGDHYNLIRVDLGFTPDDLWDWAKRLTDAGEEIRDRASVSSSVEYHICQRARDEGSAVIFEGSQGMLLDKRVGWFPHVTYGDMDAFEARRLCGKERATVIGVTRSYQTRHGAGPMPTEGTCDAPETDNVTNEWAGVFRTGLLDVPNTARAAMATCADEIAVSHMDRYPGRCVTHWEGWGKSAHCERAVPCDMCVECMDEDAFLSAMEDECMAPVTIVGRGPTLDKWTDR